MKNVHFILQGKGGVGKSTIAVLLAQYLKDKGVDFQGVDTDPVNQSFSGFKALNAKHLHVLDQGTVNQRRFDALIEEIITSKSDYVIDNGASSFIPLSSYISENKTFDTLKEHGAQVYLHTPVVAGAAMKDSLIGMKAIADMTSLQNLVVWENEYFGTVQHNGTSFEDMPVFKNSASSIMGVIHLKGRTASTFGGDMKKMLTLNKTFEECLNGDDFFVTEKSRLKIMRDDIYAEINRVGGDVWIPKK